MSDNLIPEYTGMPNMITPLCTKTLTMPKASTWTCTDPNVTLTPAEDRLSCKVASRGQHSMFMVYALPDGEALAYHRKLYLAYADVVFQLPDGTELGNIPTFVNEGSVTVPYGLELQMRLRPDGICRPDTVDTPLQGRPAFSYNITATEGTVTQVGDNLYRISATGTRGVLVPPEASYVTITTTAGSHSVSDKARIQWLPWAPTGIEGDDRAPAGSRLLQVISAPDITNTHGQAWGFHARHVI